MIEGQRLYIFRLNDHAIQPKFKEKNHTNFLLKKRYLSAKSQPKQPTSNEEFLPIL
jgi:hypothetical protein